MNKTKIEYADSTWSPVSGCRNHCSYCYARLMVSRFQGYTSHGRQTTVSPMKRVELHRPLFIKRKDGRTVQAPYPFGFEPTLYYYKLNIPTRMEKPRTIFVCSMADLFGAWVPDAWIETVFEACERAPQHRYLFLTKNPARYVELAKAGKLPLRDNMWYGTTCTNPHHHFFADPQYHTFLSIEPLLADFSGKTKAVSDNPVEWVVIGAETGTRKQKVVPEASWVETIERACAEHGVPVFMKDSLVPIVGEDNMRREFPWEASEEG